MGKRIGVLGLVNYINHPTDKGYKVFNFNTKREADLFEEELNKNRVTYERDVEDHESETMYLFAVRQQDFDKAQSANFAVSAKTRSHIIPFAFLRYALILFVLSAVSFAIYSAYMSNK